MEMVEVDGLQIAYERAGSGPALVLLHGYVGDGPTTRQRQLDGLSDEFTVVAWDAPGAGRSSDPPERFGLDGYADCLAGFLTKLGLDSARLGGLSFGGILALALQRRHSARSRALILASAYAGWAGSLPPEVRRAAPSTGARIGRWRAGGVRRCVAADDVLQDDAA
jgi:pimeloyl-ACP methyl ester carboxylesterase